MTEATASFMAQDGPTRRRRANWIAALLTGLAVLTCIGGVLFLSSDARREIDALAIANADSTQWSLAQSEVEFGALRVALLRARMAGPPPVASADGVAPEQRPELDTVRRQFDIFYSRISTISESRVFAELATTGDSPATIAGIRSFLTDTIPLIDGPDAGLYAALPTLLDRSEMLHPMVRQLSLQGVALFAGRTADQRERVFSALQRLAYLTALLVGLLLLGIVGLSVTIRQSRIQSDARKAANSRFEATVSTAIDAVIVVDDEGQILEFNHAAEETFGYSRAEALGQVMSDLIIPPPMRAAHDLGMARLRRGGETRLAGRGRIKMEGMRKDATLFPVELSVAQAQTTDGHIYVAFLRDITAQVRAEQELVRARDTAVRGEQAKARLLAVMSHEMRTPLNGILGTLDLLRDTELSPRQRNYVRIIGKSGEILLGHVNDVLDVSRIDSGHVELAREVFDLPALIGEVIDALDANARAHGNTLCAETAGIATTRLIGDPARLRQILMNLVGNAIKFTRNGQILIEAETDTKTGQTELRVVDSGIGIPTDQVDHIFDDFVMIDASYMRKSGGTGLGLGICKRLVRAMGGQIGVDSEPGAGSVFWFRVPLEAAGAPAPAAAALPEEPVRPPMPGRQLEILVVEDNQINRIVVGEMLGRMGHRVTEAHDGREGVEIAERQAFDIILMDISMPELDGVEATRRIRAGHGASRLTPILALTAHAMPEEVTRFLAAGMNDTMTKPVSRAVLAEKIALHALPEHAAELRPGPAPGGARQRRASRTALSAVSAAQVRAPAAPRSATSRQVPRRAGRRRGPGSVLEPRIAADLLATLGRSGFDRMRGEFMRDVASTVALLQDQATGVPDWAQCETICHRHAGSAGLFGALALNHVLLELETIAGRQDARAFAAGVEALGLLWPATREALAQLVLPDG